MSHFVLQILLLGITKYDPNRRSLSEPDAKFFFLQACQGLKYLHDSSITHRDIKPDNLLLATNSPDALLKISDFGLSKLVSAETMKTVCGTQLYVAPEVLFGNKSYTSKVDVWSMGCLLFAMLSGTVPFLDAYGPPDVQTQIKEARYNFKSRSWINVSKSARELIRKMLRKEPELRLSIDEVLNNIWLRDLKTISRVQRLYNLDETIVTVSDELEQTMTNISLKERPQKEKSPSVNQPPTKRPRLA